MKTISSLLIFLFLFYFSSTLCSNVGPVPIYEDPSTHSYQTDREILMYLFKQTFSQASWAFSSSWLFPGSDHCDWEGVICEETMKRVVGLELQDKGLSGELPSQLGFLDKLELLNLGQNSLQGSVPSSLSLCVGLQSLLLNENQFKEVSEELFANLTSLRELDLSWNLFERLPSQLGDHVPNVVSLKVAGNKLKQLPSSFSQLTTLQELSLSSNTELTLPIEHPIFSMSSLVRLELESLNLVDLPSLENMSSLRELFILHNSFESFPLGVIGAYNLFEFDLSYNSIKEIPSDFNKMEELRIFNCYDCDLKSTPNFTNPNLVYLRLPDNPIEFLNLTGLQKTISRIFMGTNNYIPKNLSMFFNLTEVNFQNQISFPASIPDSVLYISFVQSTATAWPSSYYTSSWPVLENFQIVDHKAPLTFPDFLFNGKPELKVVSLEGPFKGTFPSNMIANNLRAFIIRTTDIEGSIPQSVGSFKRLGSLEFSNNKKIIGVVPTEILLLSELKNLQLSHNSFDPVLPIELSKLKPHACNLENNPPFVCETQVVDAKICNVKCSGEGLTGVWISENVCTVSPMNARTNRSKLWIDESNFQYTTEDSIDCKESQVSSRWTGTFTYEIDEQEGDVKRGTMIFNVTKVEVKLLTNLAELLYVDLCFGYRSWNLNPEIGFWIDISNMRCMDSGYGYQLVYPGITQCPTYYDRFEYDSFNSILRFGEGHLFNPKKCDRKQVPQNLTEILWTRNWECSKQDQIYGCFPECGDGYLLEQDGEQCDLGYKGTRETGCFECSIMDKWECTYSMENTASSCLYVCPDESRVEVPNLCVNKNDGSSNNDTGLWTGISIGLVVLIALLVGAYLFKRKQTGKNLILIKESELEMNELLGEGQFGQVFKGVWRGTTEVAVKVLKHGTKLTKEEIESFKQEASLYMTLPPHPNIVQFLGISLSSQNEGEGGGGGENNKSTSTTKIVTEYLAGGNLLKYLKKTVVQDPNTNIINSPPYSLMLELGKGIAAGMDHLHKNQIIHRDLAARNILVHTSLNEGKQQLIPKISDFGLSGKTKGSKVVVPVRWSPPEVLKDSTQATEKSDVWSFGIVLFEISVGCHVLPYHHISQNVDVFKWVLSARQVIFPSSVPPNFISFAKSCFALSPSLRPSFTQLFEGFKEEEKKLLNNPGMEETERSTLEALTNVNSNTAPGYPEMRSTNIEVNPISNRVETYYEVENGYVGENTYHHSSEHYYHQNEEEGIPSTTNTKEDDTSHYYH